VNADILRTASYNLNIRWSNVNSPMLWWQSWVHQRSDPAMLEDSGMLVLCVYATLHLHKSVSKCRNQSLSALEAQIGSTAGTCIGARNRGYQASWWDCPQQQPKRRKIQDSSLQCDRSLSPWLSTSCWQHFWHTASSAKLTCREILHRWGLGQGCWPRLTENCTACSAAHQNTDSWMWNLLCGKLAYHG